MNQVFENKSTIPAEQADTARVLDSLRLGVLRYNADLRLNYYNLAATGILGLSGMELMDFSFEDNELNLISEDGSPFEKYLFPTLTAAHTRLPASPVIIGLISPVTRERIWLRVNATPLVDAQGRLYEVITSFEDVTQQKAARDQLDSLYHHLEIRAYELSGANADLEKFIYAATHDLQEPLRLITGFLQLLDQKYGQLLDEQAKSYIRYAVQGSGRMKKLILDLLEYSRISGNGIMMVPADMRAVLEVARQTLAGQLENCNAILNVNHLPVAVVCPPLMVQLFENLIDNALKYKSNKVPYIEVDCREEGDNWVFNISDNGIGIAGVNAGKIFDLFHRVQLDAENDGTGAGLAICQKIVTIHRGRIWVESVPGSGSSFYFTIPKLQPDYEKV